MMSTADGPTQTIGEKLNVKQEVGMVSEGGTVTGVSNQPEGAYVGGDVTVSSGDFVGRDKIERLIETVEKYIAGSYIEHQEVTQVFTLGPETMEAFISWVNRRENLSDSDVRMVLTDTPSTQTSQQLREFELAQQASPNVPMTDESAYQFGMAAAYRRDYESALAYFGVVSPESNRFDDACAGFAWIQLVVATHDIQHGDYASPKARLNSAKQAMDSILIPSDRTHEMYGYVAKSLAQIADGQKDHAARDLYYGEAKTHFQRALEMNPDAAGAFNGLGNVAYAEGDHDRAIEAYRHAIELNPAYTAAYNDLGLAYMGKLQTDAGNRTAWLEKAVVALTKSADLAVSDPGFAEDYPARIEKYVQRLIAQYGEE